MSLVSGQSVLAGGDADGFRVAVFYSYNAPIGYGPGLIQVPCETCS